MESPQYGLKVRAITRFVVLSADSSTWRAALVAASAFCSQLAAEYAAVGYEVQTLRIVTNPFGEYLDTSTRERVLGGLEALASILKAIAGPIRIRFAVGAASSVAELALVPAMIAAHGDLCNICVNVEADAHGVVDAAMCDAAAACVAELAQCTERGEGNFNFTANFACPPLIPYFPAGYNTAAVGECFGIGLEHPDLLHAVLAPLALGTVPAAQRSEAWSAASAALREAMQRHVDVLVAAAQAAAAVAGVRFAGLDSSAAPSKDVTSMCDVIKVRVHFCCSCFLSSSLFAHLLFCVHLFFCLMCDVVIKCLGVPHFGASGTVEACAFLTRVFKSVRGVDLIGFSGLMLTCLEDEGMAAAAARGEYDIRALLQYSCVCGIGLDCVPIPGDTPTAKIAALMRDTGTLAFRYKKPLTVRLFPCVDKAAGEMTAFESDDLCNCTVFAVA